MSWNPNQSAIHKEVIKVLEKEYKAEQKMLKNEFRQIIDESIKDAFEKLENSIKVNTRQLIEENHQHLLKELQYHIQGIAKLLPKEGDKTQQIGGGIEPQATIQDSDKPNPSKKSIKHDFLQIQKRPVMPILAVTFLAFMGIVIYVTLFPNMPPDKEPVQVSVNESDKKQDNKTIPKNKETTQDQEQPSSPETQPEKSVADLKTEHETYAKALSHIAKTPSAPEHIKLKELTQNISTADGLEDTTNSVSDGQKKRFSEIDLPILSEWQIKNELAVVAVEYIAAIKKCKSTVCDKITVNLEIEDITDEILTALNDSLPDSVSFDPVPQKYKDNKKASGFTEEFKEFMAAVVLAHIMQKDEKP